MIDLAINETTNDLMLNGSYDLVTTTDLRQTVIIAFRLFLGEYDFDLSIGQLWDDAFKGNVSQTDFLLEMENQIARVPEIDECTVTLERDGRDAFFNITVTSNTGETANVTIQ